MQEYEFPIAEHFRNGLAQDTRLPHNSKVLTVCRGLTAREFGAVKPPSVSTPFTLPSSFSWPFPQAMFGRTQDLLAYGTAIHTINRGTWAVSSEAVYDPDAETVTSIGAATLDGRFWHRADMGNVWFLANEANFLFRAPHISRDLDDNPVWRVFRGTQGRPTTVCAFMDTLYWGGFTGSYFSGDQWKAIWNLWLANNQSDQLTHESTAIGTSWVGWSTASGGARDWPFAMELSMFGYPAASFDEWRGEFAALVQGGSVGFAQIPDPGGVKTILPLGGRVMVYGANTVGALVPFERGHRYKKLLDTGIAGRGCVAGDEAGHVFIDSRRRLWRVGPEGALEQLRYNHYLSGLSVSTSIVLDHEDRDFHISDGQTSFVLSSTGLSEQKQHITSLVSLSGLIGVKDASGDDGAFVVRTGPFDMGRRTMKRIQCLEVGLNDVTAATAKILFRFPTDSTWRETPAVQVGDHMVAYIPCAATDFMAEISGVAGPDARIEHVRVRWQDEGKAHIRGLRSGS